LFRAPTIINNELLGKLVATPQLVYDEQLHRRLNTKPDKIKRVGIVTLTNITVY